MNSNGLIDRLDRLFLVVTNNCNARCLLCQYWKSKPKRFLPLPVIAEKVVPLIDKYNVGLTLITGGEPTLHPQLPGIIKILEKTGTRITLITNATRLDAVFDEIKDQVHAYMFSLDASNEALYHEIRGLDNFNELIAWPGRILKARPYAQVAFNCLIQKKNIKDLVDLYRLTVDLPVDGIFFNVPELKPHCFGRQEDVPEESAKNAVLDDKEIVILEENLEQMVQLDAGKGKLFQRQVFFDNCLRYFRAIRNRQTVELNDPKEVCQVPFNSIVFDESQCLYPCFYLPYSIPFGQGEEDPVNSDYLKKTRKEIFNNPGLRKKHCSFCLQYQG
ncbi:MAG: radical SAM protein [Candidatus Aminicenantes bacterium]|nr:MAG: radical SAM protein [Candidatus Aminicenantes bacterium]